jgi:hypothetical protein
MHPTSLEHALDQLTIRLAARAARHRRGDQVADGSSAALLRLADVAALTTDAAAMRDLRLYESRERLLDAAAVLQEHVV